MASAAGPEPLPRLAHYSATIDEKSCVWGGRISLRLEERPQNPLSTLYVFDPYLEVWRHYATRGPFPPGLYDGASTSHEDSLYMFGGTDGSNFYNTLHHINTITLKWIEIDVRNPLEGPIKKVGSRMVTFQDWLVLFGGYGMLNHPSQPGSKFIRDSRSAVGAGLTNEFHVLDLRRGAWISPFTSGNKPPPCSSFSFTSFSAHQAILFGGRGPYGKMNNVYIIDMKQMHWMKLKKPVAVPWPQMRVEHSACCLNIGGECPQLFVHGGVDKFHTTLGDAWLFDIDSARWKEVCLPDDPTRVWHSATAASLGPGASEVIIFGGCPRWAGPEAADDEIIGMANTTVLTFEEAKMSGTEWILTAIARDGDLGSATRIDEKISRIVHKMKIQHDEIKIAQMKACRAEQDTKLAHSAIKEMQQKVQEAERRATKSISQEQTGAAKQRYFQAEMRVHKAESRQDHQALIDAKEREIQELWSTIINM